MIKKSKYNVLMVIGIAIIGSIPVFTSYIPLGFDSYFHLIRIEGVKDALLSGQFPVRVEPTYLCGYGYAVSLFYGNLMFYVAAFFRIIGFNLQDTYKIMIFIINFIMASGAYLFFKKALGSDKKGVIGSCIYTLSVYKFVCLFYRGAISEAIAMAFLPYLAYAFWNVYMADMDEKYDYRWIPLTLAFSCVLETHIISTEVYGIAMIIICIVFWKKTFRKRTFLLLLKFTCAVVVLNLYFLYPFVDTMSHMQLRLNTWDELNYSILASGLNYNDIFSISIPVYNYQNWYEQTYNIGLGPVFAIGIGIAVAVIIKLAISKEWRKLKKLSFWTLETLVITLMCSNKFPWWNIFKVLDKAGHIGNVILVMLTNIQFWYRLLGMAALFGTMMILLSVDNLISESRKNLYGVVVYILIIISIVQTVLLESSIIATEYNSKEDLYSIESTEDTITRKIGMQEYLPVSIWLGSDFFSDRSVVVQNGTASRITKDGLNMNATITPDGNGQMWVTLPLIYYPGYEVWDKNIGEKINVFQESMGRICFVTDGSKVIDLKVNYVGKISWRIAEAISIIMFGFILLLWKRKCSNE